jgi:hypothetical protein
LPGRIQLSGTTTLAASAANLILPNQTRPGIARPGFLLFICFQWNECLRPPSPFILSPQRGNSFRLFLVLRMSVRPIQSYKFSKQRRTIPPLLPSSLRFDATVNLNRAVAQRRRGGRGPGRGRMSFLRLDIVAAPESLVSRHVTH